MSSQSYTRRCRECWHTVTSELPEIRKKVVYLDQFVISNIMKTLSPRSAGHERASKDPYWLAIYKKLETLSKYQLIICPDSVYHRSESLVGKDFEDTERIYEHLSHGVTFRRHDEIEHIQVIEHFENYVDGKGDVGPILQNGMIVHGNLHEWQDTITIGIKHRIDPDEIKRIRQQREIAYEAFKKVFEQWRGDKGMKFQDWFMEEVRGFGKGIMGNAAEEAMKRQESFAKFQRTGKIETDDLNNILPSESSLILFQMRRLLADRRIEGYEALKIMARYFISEDILNVPAIKVGALLFAAIARKAAAGQVHPPSRGVFTDVNAISSLLPYCDAMFIDNENAGYLQEVPLRNEITYPTRIFSLNTKQAFLDYLVEIWKNADPAHVTLVTDVYGQDVGKPYLTILEVEHN